MESGVELRSRAWFWHGSRGEQVRLPAGYFGQLEEEGRAKVLFLILFRSQKEDFPVGEKRDIM